LRWRRDFITLLGGAAALDKDKTKGASMVTDPKAAKVVKMVPVDSCVPHGIAFERGARHQWDKATLS
jgi:hypothetical protein